MGVPAVQTQSITHRYAERTALRDLTIEVSPGNLYGLLGPNGGGKTTLFRILSTLIRPTEGSAHVFGHQTSTDPHAVRQQLGVVFQQTALDDQLTVHENLRVHGALYGLRGRAFERRIDALLEMFELSDRRTARVDTLSGGLQRRTDLARGLLHAPALLLLDEPTTGLDPVARRSFWESLRRLRASEGTTLMVATHLLEEADDCDVVGIVNEGRLVANGPPEELTGALGAETLWLRSADPLLLRDGVRAKFGIEARLVGDAVQVAHPEAHSLLPSLYDTFGEEIESATVRRPTLQDVFMIHTGADSNRLVDVPAAFE